jgi:hypothetical protein
MNEPKTDTRTEKLAPEHAQALAMHLALERAATAELELARERRARFVDQMQGAYAARGLVLEGVDIPQGTATVRPLARLEALAEAAE